VIRIGRGVKLLITLLRGKLQTIFTSLFATGKAIIDNTSLIPHPNLPRLQIKLLTPPLPITPHSMPILIAPRTRLIKLTQTVLLRNPITPIRAMILDSDKSVRADLVWPGVLAFHGVGAVGDQVGFGAQRAAREPVR
jgi:hypothetical protein